MNNGDDSIYSSEHKPKTNRNESDRSGDASDNSPQLLSSKQADEYMSMILKTMLSGVPYTTAAAPSRHSSRRTTGDKPS
jgi:hypothetical protein